MATNIETSSESRNSSDRRQAPTSPWAALVTRGKRMKNRRTEEHMRLYFVDRFPFRTLAWIMTLLTLSIFDAFITLILLDNGCVEVNPVMNHLLNQGPLQFLIGKYVLTASGLPILLLFENYFLFGTRIRVGYLIPAMAIMYLVLICYQCCLLCA